MRLYIQYMNTAKKPLIVIFFWRIRTPVNKKNPLCHVIFIINSFTYDTAHCYLSYKIDKFALKVSSSLIDVEKSCQKMIA